jgi:hypothetical protein
MNASSKVVGKIYQTTNYSMFNYRVDNRPVNQSNINAIAKSIENMGQKHPISVDFNFNVQDGQHRLEACKKLNIPVKYIMDIDDMDTNQIAELQSTTRSWKTKDYAHGFSNDNENYAWYNKFCSEYPEFSHTCTLVLLSDKTERNTVIEDSFKTGGFKVKSIVKAREMAEILRSMSPYYKSYNKRGFVFAILKMKENKNFDLKRLLRKLPKRCKELLDFSKTEDYIDTLQDIYNWKETKKVYFH